MKAAVIGLGRIGFEFGLEEGRVQPASHVHCYLGNSLIDTIAVADVDSESIRKLQVSLPADRPKFHSYYHGPTCVDTLMSSFQPDIVSICTPTSTHKVACAVAKYKPKTIVLEKPIAQSLNEADAIIEACRKNHVALYVNYGRRWSEPYRRMSREQKSTDIVAMLGYHPGPLMRTGTHMIDLFDMLMFYGVHHGREAYENDVTVQAFGKPVLADYMKDTDDYNINGVIQYGNETSAILIANFVCPKLVLFELDVACKTMRYMVSENGSQLDVYKVNDSLRYKDLKEYEYLTTTRFPQENILQNTLNSVIIETTLDSAIPAANSRSARETLRLALGLHYSAMNDNQIVPVKAVPNDYTVRSY